MSGRRAKDPQLLARVLAAKDARHRWLAPLRAAGTTGASAVGELAMNVPGWPKRGREWLLPFVRGLSSLIDGGGVEVRALWADDAGYWAALIGSGSAAAHKRRSCAIEDAAPWGRLLDIDWYAGGKQRREDLGLAPRRCWVCDRGQDRCVSALAHDFAQVRAVAQTLARSARGRDRGGRDRG